MVAMIPLDWFASALTLASMFLTAHHRVFAGMVIGLIAQVPWLIVAMSTGLYGMLALEVIAVGIYLYGIHRHWPQKRRSDMALDRLAQGGV